MMEIRDEFLSVRPPLHLQQSALHGEPSDMHLERRGGGRLLTAGPGSTLGVTEGKWQP